MKKKPTRKLPDVLLNSPATDPRAPEPVECKVAFTLSFNGYPARPKPAKKTKVLK